MNKPGAVGLSLVTATLGLIGAMSESEIPVVSVRPEAEGWSAVYWAPHAPRVRLAALAGEDGECRVRAFQSDAPWKWRSPRREKMLLAPGLRDCAPAWRDRAAER